ncbi:MAG: hypothetical protein D6722_17200, partial [Bacteroidetes bacterium]
MGQDTRPLFESHETLAFSLAADFKNLFKDKGEEREYHPAVLSYFDEDRGDTIHMNVKLKVRGNFRRNKCQLPPIRVNFDKDSTAGTIFAGQDKLKLVMPCGKNPERFDPLVVMEYLVYRSYNLLTDSSFRARRVALTLRDASGKFDQVARATFLIEPKEHMAERLGGRELEVQHIHPDKTQYDLVNLLSVFQFMVGNTDWSVPGLHNIVLVATEPGQPPLAIPYDFDWCGIVDAPYAFPNPQLGINSVRQRVFRGFCRTPEEFEATFSRFRAQRQALLSLY